MQKSVILVGIKHCGKTTQGELLAKELTLPFFDTDRVITELAGASPRAIFSMYGKDAFCKIEYTAIQYISFKLMCEQSAAVIATGGGICNNPPAIETVRSLGPIVFLCAEEKTAADRIVRELCIHQDGTIENAPSYIAEKNPHTEEDVRAIFHEFYTERTQKYHALADVTVCMQNAPKHVNTEAILEALAAFKVVG